MKDTKKILYGISLILLGIYCLQDGIKIAIASFIFTISGGIIALFGFFQKKRNRFKLLTTQISKIDTRNL